MTRDEQVREERRDAVSGPVAGGSAFALPWKPVAGARVRAGARPAAPVAGKRVRRVS